MSELDLLVTDPADVSPSDPKGVEVLERLRNGGRVRRKLDELGRVFIDRPLPFLFVYRTPAARIDPGTSQLITGQAASLRASGRRRRQSELSTFVRTIAGGLAADFGAFLLVELWSRPQTADATDEVSPFEFVIAHGPNSDIQDTADDFEAAVEGIRVPTFPPPTVRQRRRRSIAPPRMRPLLSLDEANLLGCHLLGIEVPGIHFDSDTDETYPVVHRALRRGLTSALRQAAFRFTRNHTSHRPRHFQSLGPRSLTKSAWDVDRQLAEVSGQFDFLLLTTPRNVEEAWRGFRRARFEKPPRFSYRPRPFDVALAKRTLYEIPIERVEDPTLSELFREQQDEIDRKLTMLGDRETPRFRHESIQLFGAVEDELLDEALEILERTPLHARESRGSGRQLDARTFAARAEEEIGRLRLVHSDVKARVEIRSDISGLMVSRGNLLVGRTTKIPAARAEALIQHEVGTHVLTYYNGDAQPFRQLRTGLPMYEELQEGLAVLAEYLVGGLSTPRMRLLAARVVAAHRMLDGASFVEVFRELTVEFGFSPRQAFGIAARTYRGGGHTKDVVYLRGFIRLCEYLQGGQPFEPLYVGKIGIQHLPIIEELRLRQVLVDVPLRPSFVDRPDPLERLQKLREGARPLDLLKRSKSVRPKA